MKTQSMGFALSVLLLAAGCGDNTSGTNNVEGNPNFGASQGQGQGQPVRGAIFTTDSEGNTVNKNHFDAKEDVYLNGGPLRGNAPALSPDGEWYYQITDPGCQVLLAGPAGDGTDIPYTGDTSGKEMTVVDGFFDELMQLYPFNDTPNQGGVYKVWATPAAHYDESMDSPGGCFGFLPRFSKMDTFKVDRHDVPPPADDTYCISGHKLFDPMPGTENGALVGVSGFQIVLKGEGVNETTYTMGTEGYYEFCGLEAGDYKVTEILPPWNDIRWFAVGPTKHHVTVPAEKDDNNDDYSNGPSNDNNEMSSLQVTGMIAASFGTLNNNNNNDNDNDEYVYGSVRPVFECWQADNGTYTAYFGYLNEMGRTVHIDELDWNLTGWNDDVMPEYFEEGRHRKVIKMEEWSGEHNIVLRIDGRTSTAGLQGPECLEEPPVNGDVTEVNFVNACFIANGIDDWDAKGTLPILISLWDELVASGLLSHPIIGVYNYWFETDIDEITDIQQLRALMAINTDDKIVLFAQGVISLHLNLMADTIDEDDKVQYGTQIVTAGQLLSIAAKVGLEPFAIDTDSKAFLALLDALSGVYVLQDEPCPVLYDYDD